MGWRDILVLGSTYVKRIKFSSKVFKFPRIFKVPKIFIESKVNSYLSRLSRQTKASIQTKSLVRAVYHAVINASSQQRDGSLLRVYRGFGASVQWRHQFQSTNNNSFSQINKISRIKQTSWFLNLFSSKTCSNLPSNSSSIIPKEFIASGCNSAVWSAQIDSSSDDNNNNDRHDVSADELAVKVLYNYYANKDDASFLSYDSQFSSMDENSGSKEIPEDWILIRHQIERECKLRPQTHHPNIIPLICHFVDHAPSTHINNDHNSFAEVDCFGEKSVDQMFEKFSLNSQSSSSQIQNSKDLSNSSHRTWMGIDSISDGFKNRPLTFYMLMPRFEATLDDLLVGNWNPFTHLNSSLNCSKSLEDESNGLQSVSHNSETASNLLTSSNSDVQYKSSLSNTQDTIPSNISFSLGINANKEFSQINFCQLSMDDIICILVQLFEAVAELEKHGIAHRDIKPNNILLRKCLPLSKRKNFTINQQNSIFHSQFISNFDWLDDKEVELSNSHFNVALTDFGCAIRTKPDIYLPTSMYSNIERLIGPIKSGIDYLTHSGNSALLAPEIATIIHESEKNNSPPHLTGQDYSRSDIWAVATLIYQLIGMSNPFMDGILSPLSYDENELPALPDFVPGILSWVLSECLRRLPSTRPNADFVADVLHTWCLLRNFYRRHSDAECSDGNCANQPQINNFIKYFVNPNDHDVGDNLQSNSEMKSFLSNFLNLCWAADWLNGPAQPPKGLRTFFYSRVTPKRLALCLKIVLNQESFRANRLAQSIWTMFRNITSEKKSRNC